MSIALIQFLGSNCDRDCLHVLENIVGAQVNVVWHNAPELPPGTKAIVIPGGFSYGDYLRAGAMAALRPAMQAVKRFADLSGPVLGICNGFQILCEARILPGALMQNASGKFICRQVELEIEQATGLLCNYAQGERILLPVAHQQGSYFADAETLENLERESLIACCYVERDADGNSAMNGARLGIAGIFGGPSRNVLGLMPHPERRAESRLGGTDGLKMLEALLHV